MQWKWITPLVLFAGLSGAMHADTLNYTITPAGSGSLDGVAYGNPNGGVYGVTFTLTADSSKVVNNFTPNPSITGPVTVTVLGVGSDTINDPIRITAAGAYNVFYFIDTVNGSGFDLFSRSGQICTPGFQPCNIDFTLPYVLYGDEISASTHLFFNTAHGTFSFAANPFGPDGATFQITKAAAAVTPEPSSFLLFGSGALGMLTMLRKRHRTQAVRLPTRR